MTWQHMCLKFVVDAGYCRHDYSKKKKKILPILYDEWNCIGEIDPNSNCCAIDNSGIGNSNHSV